MLDLLLIIIEQVALYLPLVVGAYISFSLLKIPDLSIESAYVVGAVCASQLLLRGLPISSPLLLLLVLFASCVGGALVGAVSGVLTQRGKLPHLLSSIIANGLFHGINQYISPVYVTLSKVANPLLLMPGFSTHPELIMLLFICVLVVCCIALLFNTQLGYAYAIYGNNPTFFANYGINTAYVFITGVMLANGLAGLSGYLFAQSNSFLELNMGYTKALLCITAVILGKAIMRARTFSIMVPLVGAGAYFVLQQLLIKVGFNLTYFTAVQALIVAIVLIGMYRSCGEQLVQDNLGV